MRKHLIHVLLASLSWGVGHGGAFAQVIGSYDNFDCFNDTGKDAEGFEIDVQDINAGDLTREFPSNFSTTPWVIRYGLPSVASYDFTTTTPDAQHAADAGHKGVLITWAAKWDGAQWVAPYGDHPFGAGIAGHATKYVANPTYTNGDSCWYYGLGDAYPASGCDHFGISLSVAPGKIAYHWKIPNPANPGELINAAAEASIPPSPTFVPVGAGGAREVDAHAEAGENHEAVWGKAYFVKITSYFSPQGVDLDLLQKAVVGASKLRKTVRYAVLQSPPAGFVPKHHHNDIENEKIKGKNVQVTKQYEYFEFTGVFEPGSHEVECGPAYRSVADYQAGIAIPKLDACQMTGNYYTLEKATNTLIKVKKNAGKYIGAHVNAFGPDAQP